MQRIVKTLRNICRVLGLSADYVLFGSEREADALLLDKLRRLDDKYLPLVTNILNDLLALSGQG